MGVGDIYGKTALGTQEVTVRKMKLAPRLRTMLILVDGRQSALILHEDAAKVGAPSDFLDQLLGLGLIAKIGNTISHDPASVDNVPSQPASGVDEYSRFRAAKDFMNVTVVDALGIRSFFITLKLERAGNLADLRELVGTYRDAIEKGCGTDEARVFTARLNTMLR